MFNIFNGNSPEKRYTKITQKIAARIAEYSYFSYDECLAFTIEHTSVEAVEDLEKSGVEIGSLLIPILRAYELLQSAHDMKIFQDDFFNEIYNLLKPVLTSNYF